MSTDRTKPIGINIRETLAGRTLLVSWGPTGDDFLRAMGYPDESTVSRETGRYLYQCAEQRGINVLYSGLLCTDPAYQGQGEAEL